MARDSLTEKPDVNIIEGSDDDFTILHIVFDDELKQSSRFYHELGLRLQTDCTLITIGVKAWNRDLSPWKAPPVFGKDDFGDGARDMLYFIEQKITPHVMGQTIIGGYSLAGLFSLWCGYESRDFQGIAAASPSVWFPKWMEYASNHRMNAETVYLSLGDSESRTKNETVSKVAENIKEQSDLLRSTGINCILEWNKGGHFNNIEKRRIDSYVKTINGMCRVAHHP